MLANIEIPDEIISILLDNPNMSRFDLACECNISEHQARIYKWCFSNGSIIAPAPQLDVQSGLRRALLLPDIHWPYHSQKSLDLAIEYGVKKDVDTVIINGDAADNYSISYFKRDPQKVNMAEELRRLQEGLEYISEPFQGKELIYIEGNHELRWRNFLWQHAPELSGIESFDFPNVAKINDMGWKYISNSLLMQNGLPPFALGKLTILHGHEIKVNYTVVNIPRNFYLKAHVNILVSHHHQSQEYITRKLDNTHEGAWSTGCLCDLSPDYMPANNWNNGFATVVWDANGDFYVNNRKIINGKVL